MRRLLVQRRASQWKPPSMPDRSFAKPIALRSASRHQVCSSDAAQHFRGNSAPAVRKIRAHCHCRSDRSQFPSARISSSAVQSCESQQHHGIDLAGRKAFQEQPRLACTGMIRPAPLRMRFELAALQIGRQTAIVRTGVTARAAPAMQNNWSRWVTIDQAQQPLMQHFVERRAASQQGPLLRRNAEG